MSGDRTKVEPDVISLLLQLWKRRWLVMAVTLLSTLLAVAAAYLTTPVYECTATLVAADNSGSASMGLSSMLGNLGGLASLAGVNVGSDQSKVEAETLLKSRQFTERFISDLNLLPVLFADRWDPKSKSWRTINSKSPPTLYDGYRLFDERIREIVEDKKTGIVTLSIQWSDAEKAAAWANELVRRLNETMRRRAIAEAEGSIELLSVQLKVATQVELQQAISRGIETYVKQRTLASVRSEYAFRVVDPAKAPDPDDFVRPKRALYIASGPIAGFIIALFLVLVIDLLQKLRMRSAGPWPSSGPVTPPPSK